MIEKPEQTQEEFDAFLKWCNGVEPYYCSFRANGKRHAWIRFFPDMEQAHEDTKREALRQYPDASAFLTQSCQGSIDVWNSWRRELGRAWGRRDLE